MSSTTDAATLKALFSPSRVNPHDKRAKAISTVMPNSGYAKPFLAYAMGQEMQGGQEWDAEQEQALQTAQTATAKQAGDAAAMDYAQKVLANIIKVSEKDPVAATQMLKVESENGDNPVLKKFSGIAFNAPTTKDGWSTTTGTDGYVYHTYLPKIAEAIAKKNAGDDSLYNQVVIKIGEGKAAEQKEAKPPATRTVQRGGLNVTEEYDPEAKTWKEIGKGPKWEPKPPGAEKEPPLPPVSIRELQQINEERARAGQPPMTLEEYKIKSDPVNALIKSFLPQAPKGAPSAPATPVPVRPVAPAAGQLPPAAIKRLKPGVLSEFNNGQVWTIKNGVPARVK